MCRALNYNCAQKQLCSFSIVLENAQKPYKNHRVFDDDGQKPYKFIGFLSTIVTERPVHVGKYVKV